MNGKKSKYERKKIRQNLKKDFSDFKLSNKSWLIGILITLIFLLIGTLVSLIK